MESLFAALGNHLTLTRSGDNVYWTCDGRTIIVTAGPDGTLDVAFVDRPSLDVVTSELTSPVYRISGDAPYRMTPDSASRMADDMLAFFQDVREPRFDFVAAEPLSTAG
jgi:hypothetical protein